MKDIENRADIIRLVDHFYNEVQGNPTIGPIFTQITNVDWSHHLPKMYDFWESILFGKAIYKGNPMLTHFSLNDKAALRETEFTAWKTIFFDSVNQLFTGENAETIKQKAQSIADLMNFKINSPNNKINIV